MEEKMVCPMCGEEVEYFLEYDDGWAVFLVRKRDRELYHEYVKFIPSVEVFYRCPKCGREFFYLEDD